MLLTGCCCEFLGPGRGGSALLFSGSRARVLGVSLRRTFCEDFFPRGAGGLWRACRPRELVWTVGMLKTGLLLNRAFQKWNRRYSSQLVKLTQNDGVRNLLLDNPKTRNALSMEMMDSLIQGITENQDDKSLRCIVLSATGNVFSAGHNLKELTADSGTEFHKQVFAKCSDLMMAILQSPVPILAKVDGLAAAAGCQLVASCDIVICSDRSSFSTPGANFGIFCSTPGIAVARTVNRMKCAQMLLTGLPVPANEALIAGLVSSVVPMEKLDEEVDRNCEAIKSKSRQVIELGKRFFYKQIAMDIQSAYKAGEQVMVNNISLNDGQEGIRSFVEKRKPKWNHH